MRIIVASTWIDSKYRPFSRIRSINNLATDAGDGDVQKLKFMNSTPHAHTSLRSNVNFGYGGDLIIRFCFGRRSDPIYRYWSNSLNLYDTIDFSKNDTQREKNIIEDCMIVERLSRLWKWHNIIALVVCCRLFAYNIYFMYLCFLFLSVLNPNLSE